MLLRAIICMISMVLPIAQIARAKELSECSCENDKTTPRIAETAETVTIASVDTILLSNKITHPLSTEGFYGARYYSPDFVRSAYDHSLRNRRNPELLQEGESHSGGSAFWQCGNSSHTQNK